MSPDRLVFSVPELPSFFSACINWTFLHSYFDYLKKTQLQICLF